MIENIAFQTPEPTSPFITNLKQNINNLNQPMISIRKQSIKNLYNILTTQQISTQEFQEFGKEFLKNILSGFLDASQQVRQYCVKIVMELIIRSQEVDNMLSYIMSVLVERLNCGDLEGTKNLPDSIKPPPGQKPHMVIRLIQTSQEVRLSICKLIQKIIGLVDVNTMRRHVDDMVNAIRALVMDPCSDIQLIACNLLSIFSNTYKNILLHYTETMARSILLPLISKKSKIRIAALNALNKVLECGVWKYNAFVFQNLIGFKDPNSVAIKQFYQPSVGINYLASLIVDTNVKVRQVFMNSLFFWICVLDDKYDHHAKLVPYVLSGLFDQQQSIRQFAFKTLEEIGVQIEKQKHAEFKQGIQYGTNPAWSWEGKLNNQIKLPNPFISRPRLGSRFFIRGHIRKYWPALFRQIRDINIDHRRKAVNLALMGIIYTQQYMTSHLDKFIPNFITSLRVLSPQDVYVSQKVGQLFFYLGVYCPYSSYIHIIKSGISGELVQNQQFVQSTFKALAKLMEGSMYAIPTDSGLCHKKKQISQLLNLINELQLYNQINQSNAKAVEQLVVILMNAIEQKGSTEDKQQLFGAHFVDLLKLLMISLYQQQLGKLSSHTIKTVQPLNFNEKLSDSLKIVNALLPTYIQSVEQELQNMFNNPPSLNESDFKFLIGLYVNIIYNQEYKKTIQIMNQLISQSLSFNKIPQLNDFFFKFIRSLTIADSFNNNSLVYLTNVILNSQLNLSKFKSYRKTASYQDQKQQNPDEILVVEQYAQTIFNHLVELILQIQKKKIEEGQQQLVISNILYGYIKVVNSFKRMKQLAANSIRPVWALFERNRNLNVEKLIYQKQYLLPGIIDYLVQRMETIESGTQMYNLTIVTLSKIFQMFPVATDALTKLPMHYPDYPSLLTKLFKYCLNEKDAQSKQKLKNMLVILGSKLKNWFQLEYKDAVSRGMHQRSKLISEIIQ